MAAHSGELRQSTQIAFHATLSIDQYINSLSVFKALKLFHNFITIETKQRTARAYLTRNIPRIESEIMKGKSRKRTHMNVWY